MTIDIHVIEVATGKRVETHGYTGLPTGHTVGLGDRLNINTGTGVVSVIPTGDAGEIEMTHVIEFVDRSRVVGLPSFGLGMISHKLLKGRRVDLRTSLNALLYLADSVFYSVDFTQDGLSSGSSIAHGGVLCPRNLCKKVVTKK